MDYYVKNNMIALNGFYGSPTPSMISYQSSLNSLRDEVFTKIIMGASPLSDFDVFVQNWRRQGGDAITREVNEWLAGR